MTIKDHLLEVFFSDDRCLGNILHSLSMLYYLVSGSTNMFLSSLLDFNSFNDMSV